MRLTCPECKIESEIEEVRGEPRCRYCETLFITKRGEKKEDEN